MSVRDTAERTANMLVKAPMRPKFQTIATNHGGGGGIYGKTWAVPPSV